MKHVQGSTPRLSSYMPPLTLVIYIIQLGSDDQPHTFVLSGTCLSHTYQLACMACQLTPDCRLTAASNCSHSHAFITVGKKTPESNEK